MPQQQSANSSQQSFGQNANHAQWLVQYPAMTVIVFMRRNVGFRLLNPFTLVMTAVLIVIVASAANSDARPCDLMIFASLSAAVGLYQRFERWRTFRRGVKQHSYYIGSSIFDSPKLPNFLRRHRRVERLVDPAVCILAGVLLIPCSALLGVWLFVAGACLKAYEDAVHRKELHERLDIVDGLVGAEFHGQTMDRFSETPAINNLQQEKVQGIATGLASDLTEQIKNRKSKRSRPKQNK